MLAVALGMPLENASKELVPISSRKQALATFADPVIFLFFGGFALATALHIQKLDRKIAMSIISMSGGHLGFRVYLFLRLLLHCQCGFPTPPTAAMMLPLALGLLSRLDAAKERKTFIFILLGIPYSASLGGLGTLVSYPPNAIAAKALSL